MLFINRLEGGPKKANHASVQIDGFVYSFGGCFTNKDYKIIKPIDVFMLNTFTLRWSVVYFSDNGHSHNVPFQRYGHTVVARDNKVYLWGGQNVTYCNKIFIFDINTKKWTAPSVKGTIPGLF